MLSIGLSSCCGPLSGRCSLLWRHFVAFTERGFLCARGYACALTWCALFGYAWPTQAHAHFPQDICCGSLPRHVAINHCLREHKHNLKLLNRKLAQRISISTNCDGVCITTAVGKLKDISKAVPFTVIVQAGIEMFNEFTL